MYVCSVADLLFVQGTEVIFKVALCLLSNHEGEILECDGFESIVDYLKSTIPTLTHSQMEETITKVHLKWNKLYSCMYGDLISSTKKTKKHETLFKGKCMVWILSAIIFSFSPFVISFFWHQLFKSPTV